MLRSKTVLIPCVIAFTPFPPTSKVIERSSNRGTESSEKCASVERNKYEALCYVQCHLINVVLNRKSQHSVRSEREPQYILCELFKRAEEVASAPGRAYKHLRPVTESCNRVFCEKDALDDQLKLLASFCQSVRLQVKVILTTTSA
ncbi:uncharacterized protein V6R79_007579 [Siganus canaliculatus]